MRTIYRVAILPSLSRRRILNATAIYKFEFQVRFTIFTKYYLVLRYQLVTVDHQLWTSVEN